MLIMVTLYIFNNNSTDKTAEIALKAGAEVRHVSMKGKGNVVGNVVENSPSHIKHEVMGIILVLLTVDGLAVFSVTAKRSSQSDSFFPAEVIEVSVT